MKEFYPFCQQDGVQIRGGGKAGRSCCSRLQAGGAPCHFWLWLSAHLWAGNALPLSIFYISYFRFHICEEFRLNLGGLYIAIIIVPVGIMHKLHWKTDWLYNFLDAHSLEQGLKGSKSRVFIVKMFHWFITCVWFLLNPFLSWALWNGCITCQYMRAPWFEAMEQLTVSNFLVS